MSGYIRIDDACAEVDKGDLLVGDNALWAKEIIRRTAQADVKEVVRSTWRIYKDGSAVCNAPAVRVPSADTPFSTRRRR